MMETHYGDGRVEQKVVPLNQVPARMQDLLADPAVQEIRTRKIAVGEEFEIGGRTLRFTDAGWRAVNRRNPKKTRELTPVERRLVGDTKR